MELISTVAAAAFAAGFLTRGVLARERNDRDDIEQYLADRRHELQQRYETTQMDYVEFGDRITVHEQPGTERIMRDAIQVDGIGVEVALEIAKTFEGDYEAYRDADREELESVNGVGENRATALLNC